MADIQFPNVVFGPGTFDAVVNDNNGVPSNVLEAGDPFTITTSWNIGALAALLLGGQWEVTAYAESIGPGPEVQLATSGPIALTGALAYSASLTVAGNTVPNPPAAGDSGVFKIVTVLTHRNFGVISNVAAVVEGPVVRIS